MNKEIENSDVRIEQLAQLLSVNTKTAVANVVLATLLAYMLSGDLPQMMIFNWLLAVFTVNVVRMYIGRYFLTHTVEEPRLINMRLNIFRLGLFLTASLWGASSYLVYGGGHIEHQLFIAFMLTGLSAGTAVVYSIEIISALSFLLFAVLPMLIGFAFTKDSTLIAMCISGAFYVIFVAGSIKTFNQRLIENVLLRFAAVNNAEATRQLAFYDMLTSLPNRRLLLERLERSFLSSQRTGKLIAIMFIDLDHFKKLNDTLGHDKGDELLRQVATRLKQSVRASDTVSRFGGDEFVVMLENLSADSQVALVETNKIAQFILTELNKPYNLGKIEYLSTPSIGVAILGEHGETQQDLLKHADIAMYHAKKISRNTVCIYDENLMKQN